MEKVAITTLAARLGTTTREILAAYPGRVCVYGNEVDLEGRENIADDEALEIAAEDPSVLYVWVLSAGETALLGPLRAMLDQFPG